MNGKTSQNSNIYRPEAYRRRYNTHTDRRIANPDDPPVKHPPRGPRGAIPGPNYLGLPGRVALVQGQAFLVTLILIFQLWLVTNALHQLLSGNTVVLGWLALGSGLGFVLALIVVFWPRRRIKEP